MEDENMAATLTSVLRRRFRLQHATTLAGLVVAVLLVVTVGVTESVPSHPDATAQRGQPAARQPVPAPRASEQVAYYRVSSQEQALLVRSWAWYEHALLAA